MENKKGNEDYNKESFINKYELNKTNYKALLTKKIIHLQNENESILCINIKNKRTNNIIKNIIQSLLKLLTICFLIIYYFLFLYKIKKNILRKLNSEYQ